MVVKNINDLIRFDFTDECKNCIFRKQFSQFEYCCSFVFEQLEKNYSNLLKKQVLSYIFLDDNLHKINPSNIYFQDDELNVVMTFKTNLKEDKQLILQELKKAVSNSPYFTSVHFVKDTLMSNDTIKI